MRRTKATKPGRISEVVAQISVEEKSDVLLYSGAIDSPHDFRLIGEIRKHKKHQNVLLFLTTGGGSADSAYRMMRALQCAYSSGSITIVVNYFCKSAGTLMVVGADRIAMADDAELGPLDVQLPKPDEVGERTSGLTPLQALMALRAEAFNSFEEHFLQLRQKSDFQLTTRTAAEIATKLTTGWFQPLYEQLDPMRLSETQRAMMIAWEYGTRLASRSGIDGDSLQQLISGYPAHGFIIDRMEADLLFPQVRATTDLENRLARLLAKNGFIDEGMNGEEPIVFSLTGQQIDEVESKNNKVHNDTGANEQHVEAQAREGSDGQQANGNGIP